MTKDDVARAIRRAGIIAIVRTDSPEQALDLAEACIAGGVTVLEVALTTPGGLEVITTLQQRHAGKVLIGAGTVLNAETVHRAVDAGAQFILSPGFDAGMVRACTERGVVSIPGAMTPSEVIAAAEAGADIVKIFPAEALGPHYIAALRGPLPNIAMMPTGGVTLENLGSWFRYGAVAVGVGGSMTEPAKYGNYAGVTANATAFVGRMAGIQR